MQWSGRTEHRLAHSNGGRVEIRHLWRQRRQWDLYGRGSSRRSDADFRSEPATKGTVTVSNGGQITLNTDNNGGELGLAVGQGGGTGVVTVTGSGSKFVISGNNNNSGNQGGATIGQSGNGTFNILGGGEFNINNTGTAGNGSIAIGGDGYQVRPARRLEQASSTCPRRISTNLQSPHSYILAGYSGNGALNVMDGGSVTSELLQVAVLEGSTGAVSVNGGSFSLSGADSAAGARAVIGIGGVGSVSLANGSTLAITSTANNGGIYLGGNSSTSGGVGTMTVAV